MQGRPENMEDFFNIISNINGSSVSLFGIFDGHHGDFVSEYAKDIIMPYISQKITEVLNYISEKTKTLKNNSTKNDQKKSEMPEEEEEEEEVIDPISRYVTIDNKVNYEMLLNEEIVYSDNILIDRMSKAAIFSGSTCCMILIDLANKQIVCANVGDSRAIMCDFKGNAVALSRDHKPNEDDEMKRIQDNGGTVVEKDGCFRVEGNLLADHKIL